MQPDGMCKTIVVSVACFRRLSSLLTCHQDHACTRGYLQHVATKLLQHTRNTKLLQHAMQNTQRKQQVTEGATTLRESVTVS